MSDHELTAAQRTCEYCRYFRASELAPDGECMFSPPTVVTFQGGDIGGSVYLPRVQSKRPRVEPEDWCSNFD